jgi:formamidopyrimidine-DNA glycosylase
MDAPDPDMPELPEVETIRRGLIPVLSGQRLARVDARRGDLRVPFPRDFAQRLSGRQVQALRRRAKYLLLDLDRGETLIVHLGMSGRFTVHQPAMTVRPGRFIQKMPGDGSGGGKHDHVVFETEEGARVVFTDHRRFGLMLLADTDQLESHELFAGLGPEPLDESFTSDLLDSVIKGKRAPIKSALLDQRVVAGLGNIYVCEALFRARISPKRLAGSVAGTRATRLVPAIKAVLEAALKAGGSSLRDYARIDGELGDFQAHFSVYDREEGRCARKGCGGIIRRIVQSGRSTYYCPTCQR